MDTSTTPSAFTPEILDALRAPFPWDLIEVRPGSVRKDGEGALALAYADPRVYMERLDTVVGPEHWSVEFVPWGDHRLICRLTIFGVVKCSTGEADPKDKNAGTIAEAQALKRACVAFGVGRYLYELPQVWARGSGDSRSFKFDNPGRIIDEMRHKHELARARTATPVLPEPTTASTEAASARSAPVHGRTSAPSQPGMPASPRKQATARAALDQAERRTGLRPARQA